MRFDKRKIFWYALLLLWAGTSTAHAQVVLWSVTGPSGPTRLSGDTTQSYEFWIQPNADTDSAVLEIFDAALGGTADIVQGSSAMSTRFRLFAFDDVFSSASLPLTRKQSTGSPIAELTPTDEVRMVNRWTQLAGLRSRSSRNGWILVVDVTDGNDVNSYKLDVRDPLTGRSVWTIGTFDLPLCLYSVAAGSEVQVRALGGTWGSIPAISVAGAEGAPIRLRNDEGDTRRINSPNPKNAVSSTWGIAIEGSPGAINNLVVSVPDRSILWDARPILVKLPRRPKITVVPVGGNDCQELRFVLASGRYPGRTDRPQWRYGDQTFTGDTISVTFPAYGKHQVDVLVPTFTRTLPRYWREQVSVRLSPLRKPLSLPTEPSQARKTG